MKNTAELPSFIPSTEREAWLFSCLQSMEGVNGVQTQELQLKDQLIHNYDIKVQALTQELAYLKRIRFGARSEALSHVQRDMFEDDVAQDIAEVTAKALALLADASTEQPKKREQGGRRPLPAELPRVDHVHEPQSCQCGQCGQALVKFGEDITERLDVEPARFFVVRHIRPKYACRHCETVVASPAPPTVIDGGLAEPGLLAWVMTQKFADHLPLYRIEQLSGRHGLTLPRSTLASWVGQVGVALQPLVDRLAQILRQQPVLHADETPVGQLDPGRGKTKRAYLWAYRNSPLLEHPHIIIFDYQGGRSGEHARNFLQKWQGHLVVDDYGGYKACFADGQVIELGCMAHARRKFFDLTASQPHPVAAEVLARIARLYQVEREADEAVCASAVERITLRLALRQEKSVPLLADLHAWMLNLRVKTAPGSGLARALDYSLKRWAALSRYVESGEFPIDNNPIENAIRPIAIGKKNWLFVGTERAGQRAAAIQSLFATAKANGLEPHAWLKDTLERLPTHPYSRIDELLPFPKPIE